VRSDWPAGEDAVGAAGTEGVDEGVDVSASGGVVGAIVAEAEVGVASTADRVGGRAIFAVGEGGMAVVGAGVGLRYISVTPSAGELSILVTRR
jgi:hypothetical protein